MSQLHMTSKAHLTQQKISLYLSTQLHNNNNDYGSWWTRKASSSFLLACIFREISIEHTVYSENRKILKILHYIVVGSSADNMLCIKYF